MGEKMAAKDRQLEEQASRISELEGENQRKDVELEHKSMLIQSNEEYKELVKHMMRKNSS